MHRRSRRASVRAVLAMLAVAVLASGCQPEVGATPRITPGTAAAPRELILVAREWTFGPPVVDLVPGETIVLRLVNGGTEVHEAVFGGPDVQAAWEAAEAAVAGAPPGPTPTVSVAPHLAGLRAVARSGERVDLTWTVPRTAPAHDGPWVVGCHIPGHYERGMVVPVRWVGADGVPLASPATSGRS